MLLSHVIYATHLSQTNRSWYQKFLKTKIILKRKLQQEYYYGANVNADLKQTETYIRSR